MGTILGYPGLAVLLLGVLEFLVTVPLLKGKVVTAMAGVALLVLRGAGLLVLVVGTCRSAKPRSIWARWMYDDTAPSTAGQSPGPPPRELTVAFWLLGAGSTIGIASQGFVSIFVGIVVPHLMLVRAGRRRSRNVVAVLSAAGAALGLALPAGMLIASPAALNRDYTITVGVVLLVVVMTATALGLLYRDPVRRYLNADRDPVPRRTSGTLAR